MIECPVCGGGGCDQCSDGKFRIEQCPRDMMGSRFVRLVNLAAVCGGGDWPVAGGLLDQSASFLALKQRLDSEINQIDHEELERGKRRKH